MQTEELARENHMFLTVTVPQRMFETGFEKAIASAAMIAHEAREFRDYEKMNEFCHYGWGNGYLGITAEAAEFWQRSEIDPFSVAIRLSSAIVGEFNDCAEIQIAGSVLVFKIEDYETDDAEKGFTYVSNPLELRSGSRIDRRVVIRLKQLQKTG